MKIILSFIRLTESGIFEKVTWTKLPDGTKQASIEAVKPTPEDALKIATSRYQEITLTPLM